MNTRPKFLVFAGYALIGVAYILGILVAHLILINYRVVAHGILGLAIWFLVIRFFVLPKNQQQPNNMSVREALFIFPTNIQLLTLGFFWALVLYLALWEIISTIQYLIRQIGT